MIAVPLIKDHSGMFYAIIAEPGPTDPQEIERGAHEFLKRYPNRHPEGESSIERPDGAILKESFVAPCDTVVAWKVREMFPSLWRSLRRPPRLWLTAV